MAYSAGQKVRAADLNAGLEDTGWLPLAAATGSGLSGSGSVRRIGRLGDVTFAASFAGVYPAGMALAQLPDGIRPTRDLWRTGTFWGSQAHFGILVRASDGMIVNSDSSVSSRTGVVFGFTFTI